MVRIVRTGHVTFIFWGNNRILLLLDCTRVTDEQTYQMVRVFTKTWPESQMVVVRTDRDIDTMGGPLAWFLGGLMWLRYRKSFRLANDIMEEETAE